MKKRFTLLATTIAFFMIAACNSNSGTDIKKSENENKSESTIKDPTGDTDKKQPSNYDLLQGKWQSTDDKTNFLVFDKNRRKEIAEGMQTWDDEEFVLADQCQNETDKANNNSKEKDRYISCKKSDLCWYIIALSDEKLSLQYMGRGNTLTYTRVKK